MKQEEIYTLAHLARIAASEQFVEKVGKDINRMLQLIDQLQQVDTQGVEPLSHPLDACQRLRLDEITETNQRNSLQRNAPAIEDGLFLVPRVID